MQRRTQAFLLIGFGLIVILGVVFWIVWPLFKKAPETYNQPPAYPEGVPTEPIQTAPTPAAVTPPDPAAVDARRLEDRLRRMAQDFASRAGTYSNADDFAALRDAGLEATPGVRTFLSQERSRLSAAHPLSAGPWGQTVRGLASKIVTPTPIHAQQEVSVQVDAQVITEAGLGEPVTSYRQALITYQRSGDAWIVSRIQWVEQES